MEGFAGDEFKFKAKALYQTEGFNYNWEIRDDDTGTLIFKDSGISTTYKFKRTGKFSVRLKTISPDGQEDIDTQSLSIESRQPIAQFSHSVSHNETPNTFVFDATRSYDPDLFDEGKLQYEWSVNGEPIQLQNSSRNGAIGEYTFNKLGTHTVVLRVSDEEGKVGETKSDVSIKNLLSLRMNMSPQIVRR